jgi:hypothetical protein
MSISLWKKAIVRMLGSNNNSQFRVLHDERSKWKIGREVGKSLSCRSEGGHVKTGVPLDEISWGDASEVLAVVSVVGEAVATRALGCQRGEGRKRVGHTLVLAAY